MTIEPQYVTQEQFKMVMDLLHENRDVIREQVSGLVKQVQELSEQHKQGNLAITSRLDKANGIVLKHDDCLKALKSELDDAVQVIRDIKDNGCDQHVEHLQLMSRLNEEGTLVPGGWTLKHTKVTIFGVSVTAIILAIFGPYWLPLVHRLLHWLGVE